MLCCTPDDAGWVSTRECKFLGPLNLTAALEQAARAGGQTGQPAPETDAGDAPGKDTP